MAGTGCCSLLGVVLDGGGLMKILWVRFTIAVPRAIRALPDCEHAVLHTSGTLNGCEKLLPEEVPLFQDISVLDALRRFPAGIVVYSDVSQFRMPNKLPAGVLSIYWQASDTNTGATRRTGHIRVEKKCDLHLVSRADFDPDVAVLPSPEEGKLNEWRQEFLSKLESL